MSKNQVRRLKEKIANNKKLMLLAASFLFLLLIGSGYALLQTSMSLEGQAEIIAQAEEQICESDIVPTFEFSGNSWYTNDIYTYVYNLRIDNNGTEQTDGWKIIIKTDVDDIGMNYTNAQTDIAEDGTITLSSYDWNGAINPGQFYELEVALTTTSPELNVIYARFNQCTLIGNGTTGGGESGGDNPGEDIGGGDTTIELESISLSPLSHTMFPNKKLLLTVSKTPEDAYATYTFESNNTSVATVDENGEVTSIAPGTAIITITANNGMSATSTIEVVAKEQSDLAFEVTQTYSGLNELTGYEEIHFQVDITNNSDDAVYEYSFEFNLPEGTEYEFWRVPCSDAGIANGNVISITSPYQAIEVGQLATITGKIILPLGYLASDFEEVTIKNIVF